MRGWRPDDWHEIVKTTKPPHPPIMYLDGRLLFEDGVELGADAMLAELRKKGAHFRKDQILTGEPAGTMVYIPDDKENDDRD